ncbi:MAG: amino acid permease [Candidatus Methanoperedens sp.]|nr:amino acid permease [Candidatus Methanoperedens sp.]
MNSGSGIPKKLREELTFFDLTNIVVGSIVGADIYIASALTAGLIGPFSIIVWLVAGVLATIIALVYAYCSYYVPRVGGPFAFVSYAFDDFYGFLTGWSMWIAELLALPVFAIAFVQYLQYFFPLDFFQQVVVKGVFLFTLVFINIIGVKAAGRANDFLTIIKLIPLVLLVFGGILLFIFNPGTLVTNYTPLAPLGLKNFGAALVLILWAYAGFELGTLPASEVKDPKKTIPKAIITGMMIVTAFYLSTNFVIYGVVNWSKLATSATPLVDVALVIFGAVGAIIMAVGALLSVSGSDGSNVLTTARLSYAMSIDGLFPRIFSRIHPKYGTPYIALLIHGTIAFTLSIYSGLPGLISFSVFNLAFSYLLTCLALIIIKKETEKNLYGQNILPWFGVGICLYLIYSTAIFDKVVGSVLILFGILLYVFFTPKTDIHHLKELFISEENIFINTMEKKYRFLANIIRLLHQAYRKVKRI